MSTTPLIELKNVVFAYGDRSILHDINFTVEQGNSAATMSGSGSDEATLMHLTAGQIHPQQGRILIEGRSVARFSDAELYEHRRRMGVLFQHGALFIDLSVYDNIAFPMREPTGLPGDVTRDLVVLKLSAVDLRGAEYPMPSELFGDTSRRVALARTVALDPRTMFYDESFTGLSLISLSVIVHLISRVNKALRLINIMIAHDIGESLEIVNQIIFLARDEIIFSGSPQGMREFDSPWIRQFIGDLADGPITFRYPAQAMLQQDLIG